MKESDNNIIISDTFCFWSDLLGYGKPFKSSNWNLTTESAIKNLQRIKNLEKILKHIPVPIAERVLFLNDGIIRNVDVYVTGTYVETFLTWLEWTIKLFDKINIVDKKHGYPGARGVLTVGQRAQYTDELIKTSELIKGYEDDEIVVYAPKEFQMNTAFSKAYIIEESGSKHGVAGANLFIDETFLLYFNTLINNSDIQEMMKLNNDEYDKKQPLGDQAEIWNVKYTSEFIKKDDSIQFVVYVSPVIIKNIKPTKFMIIDFDTSIVEYDNIKANIKTNLFVVNKIWTLEGKEYILNKGIV